MANKSNRSAREPKDWLIEGSRLALLTLADKGLSTPKSFTEYYMMFAKRYNFIAHMAPFTDRRHKHAWFKREFLAHDSAHQVGPNDFGNPFLH